MLGASNSTRRLDLDLVLYRSVTYVAGNKQHVQRTRKRKLSCCTRSRNDRKLSYRSPTVPLSCSRCVIDLHVPVHVLCLAEFNN